jgi:beta-aspartyl-dipeptidase (metallo-type)
MLTLLKNATVYTPEPVGQQDLLLAGGRIVQVAPQIELTATGCPVLEHDLGGTIVTPGLIDQHVHLLGGGGEGGPMTMTPEVNLSDLTTAGVTSVIGCLGTDGITRHVDRLLVKARALIQEGVSAFVLTGAYQVPPPTVTGKIMSDIMLLEQVIGVGEVAIADHRSAQPTRDELARIAAEARVGGMLAGKGGKVTLHVGAGPSGLEMVFSIITNTEIPVEQFVPTHMNRNEEVLKWAVKFGLAGGYVDLTASESEAERDCPTVGQAVVTLLKAGVSGRKVTMSSDGNGSLPKFDSSGALAGMGVGKVSALTQTFRRLVRQYDIPFETALKTVTSNVADCQRLHGKGRIQDDCDADLVVFDQNLEVLHVIARGRFVVQDKKPVVWGTFEKED